MAIDQAPTTQPTIPWHWAPRRITLFRLWLGILVLVSGGIVTYVLSAYQVRSRLITFSVGKHVISIWQLQRFDEETQLESDPRQILDRPVNLLDFMLRTLFRSKQYVAGNTPQEIETNILFMRIERQRLFAQFGELENGIINAIRIPTPGFVLEDPSRIDKGNLRSNLKVISEAVATVNLSGPVIKTLDEAKKLAAEIEFIGAAIESEDKRLAELRERLELQQRAYRERFIVVARSITGDKELGESEAIKIRDAVTELSSLSRRFWMFGNLLFVPHEFLTIVIAVAAGVLGCTVQIGRDVFFRPVDASSRTLGEPLFGGLVALVLFIVVKAGVLIAVEPKGANLIAGELNPFFVAFLGVVAGLLSEQVVDRIKSTGQDWLGGAIGSRPRWFVAKSLADPDRYAVAAQLAGYLGTDRALVEQWLLGIAPAPQREQVVIAAYFKKDLRELFSDIPPTHPVPDQRTAN